ncbi:MAG: hypothetical protein JW884_06230, partial [Deltaproteobacteria bacterium]|nr:hypothetical protein [Deltaproteobacteria bacterium]
GAAGRYDLEVVLETSGIQTEIARLTARIGEIETLMESLTGKRKQYYRLLLASLARKREYLQRCDPANPVVSAWCVDSTENLSGVVGTIEVPGERGTVLIRPGESAAYDPARDGVLRPSAALSPAGSFYNLAMKPGWQKWKPTYRFGTIASLAGDICSVVLEAAANSETGLSINQTNVLSNVPIGYMT